MKRGNFAFVLIVVAATMLSSCNKKLDGEYISTINPNHKLIFNGDKMTLETQYGKMDYEYKVKGGKVYTKSGIYPIAENGCIYAMNEDYCKGNQ